jgi:deoxyribodipyrimidine photo-lyase
LEPRINWVKGFKSAWQPGETGAKTQMEHFLREALTHYSLNRDRPDLPGTSRLSPHLHFGEIGPRQIWHGLASSLGTTSTEATAEPSLESPRKRRAHPTQSSWRDSQFLTELGWREFAHHLLYHFPKTPTEPLREEFKKFPWHRDAKFLKAWQQGQTGYPFVDAGLRELWTTGWMHNRVRMVVASFLVKDLLISWTEGAAWFWDTLVDADLAQNTLGWQWTAGCGADAAPYFRVFNPISQGEKFDPLGAYVRRWCPELQRMPENWIHHPWEAPAEVLQEAGVVLGRTYPEPMLSHTIAREVALEAFGKMKRA